MASSLTTSFIFGQKDVATAGTQLQLDSTTTRRVRFVLLIAHSDNAGRIFYGGSDVDSSTQKGLAPGESVSIDGVAPFPIGDIYIDSANNNDGVDFVGVLA